ncbi:MAG: hypothetical protein ABI867_03735 [Kofleriaceae bacterium]
MRLASLCAVVACSSGHSSSEAAPKVEIKDGLCITKGTVAIGARVTDPTMRAVKLGSSGDAATLSFVYRGDSETTRALASGKERRQLGIKLRAQNGCNVVYVMWRLDPKPMLDVSVKYNPGAVSHNDCGAGGYTKVKPDEETRVPVLAIGDKHVLRAAIEKGELRAYIDDKLAWRGVLPATASAMTGPAGMRSDNVTFDVVAFEAPPGNGGVPASTKCVAEEHD